MRYIGRPRIVRYGTERVGVTEVPVTPPSQADCLVEKKLYLIHSHRLWNKMRVD